MPAQIQRAVSRRKAIPISQHLGTTTLESKTLKIFSTEITVMFQNAIASAAQTQPQVTSSFSTIAVQIKSPISGQLEWVELQVPWTTEALSNLAKLVKEKGPDAVWLRAGSANKVACGPITEVDAGIATVCIGQPTHHQFVKYPPMWKHPEWRGTSDMCLLEGAYRSITDTTSDIAVGFSDDPVVCSTLLTAEDKVDTVHGPNPGYTTQAARWSVFVKVRERHDAVD